MSKDQRSLVVGALAVLAFYHFSRARTAALGSGAAPAPSEPPLLDAVLNAVGVWDATATPAPAPAVLPRISEAQTTPPLIDTGWGSTGTGYHLL